MGKIYVNFFLNKNENGSNKYVSRCTMSLLHIIWKSYIQNNTNCPCLLSLHKNNISSNIYSQESKQVNMMCKIANNDSALSAPVSGWSQCCAFIYKYISDVSTQYCKIKDIKRY